MSDAAPTTGTHIVGDLFVDRQQGWVWVCTVAGTPGTWVRAVDDLTALRERLAAAEAEVEKLKRYLSSAGGMGKELFDRANAAEAKLAAAEAVVEEVPEALRVGAMMGVHMTPLRKAYRAYADTLSPNPVCATCGRASHPDAPGAC